MEGLKNILRGLGILFAALLVIQGTALGQVKNLDIGVVVPLSGGSAHSGDQQKIGASLAALEINEKGGLDIGGEKYRINLIFYDSRCIPSEGVSATNRLITRDKVKFIIGDICSSVSAAMMEVCERAKVIQISPQSSTPLLTSTGKKYIFAMNYTSDQWEIPFARFAINELKLKTFATIARNDEWGKSAAKAFNETIQTLGGKVLETHFYEHGATDFYPALTKIKALNPDGLRVIALHEDGSMIIKQARELALNCKILGTNVHSTSEFIRDLGPLANGIYTAAHPPETPKVKQYEEKAKKLLGKDAEDLSRLGYDTLYVLAQALERAKAVEDTDKVRNALLRTDYEGLNGHLTFAPNGRVRMNLWVRTITDGKQIWIKGLPTD
jgi:branched-chain amino acid transport system substrate-binding protein